METKVPSSISLFFITKKRDIICLRALMHEMCVGMRETKTKTVCRSRQTFFVVYEDTNLRIYTNIRMTTNTDGNRHYS